MTLGLPFYGRNQRTGFLSLSLLLFPLPSLFSIPLSFPFSLSLSSKKKKGDWTTYEDLLKQKSTLNPENDVAIVNGNSVSYNGPLTIRKKTKLALQNEIGGVMMFGELLFLFPFFFFEKERKEKGEGEKEKREGKERKGKEKKEKNMETKNWFEKDLILFSFSLSLYFSIFLSLSLSFSIFLYLSLSLSSLLLSDGKQGKIVVSKKSKEMEIHMLLLALRENIIAY